MIRVVEHKQIEDEQKVLLPHSPDTPHDQTNVLSFRSATFDPSKIDQQILLAPAPSPIPIPSTSTSITMDTHTEKDGERDGEKEALVLEVNESTQEEKHVVKSMSLGKFFANKISALTDKFRGNARGNTYRKVDNEEEKTQEKQDKEDKNNKQKSHSKKHSKLDVSSLNAVTRNLHLSYLLAIAVIIGGLLAGFLVIQLIMFYFYYLFSFLQLFQLTNPINLDYENILDSFIENFNRFPR